MSEKKILLLGAGLVTEPLVRYLLDIPDFKLTIASRTVSKAENLLKGHPRGIAVSLNVKNEEELGQAVKNHDLSISLLPATMHPVVAKYCLKYRKHLMTTSYVSPAMKAFDNEAKNSGLLFMNELGLDPGIDHMSAMRIIHQVYASDGKVLSFKSYCGGLPAPEANTNPFGYKFSWAPKGVLLAGRNAAKFLWDGELKEIPGEALFDNYHYMNVGGMEFEAYPNRDSMPYQDLYGLHDVHTMFRGTFRYRGWCQTLKSIVNMGYLDLEEKDYHVNTYADLTKKLVGYTKDNLRQSVAEKIGKPVDHFVLDNIKWLGLMDEIHLPKDVNSPIDYLAALCIEKLKYQPGERDMIVLHHIFEIEMEGQQKTATSTLIDYGIPHGQTAMARTVSLPAAIGTKLILQDKITSCGVKIPVDPEVYNPILNELEKMNIKCIERGL